MHVMYIDKIISGKFKNCMKHNDTSKKVFLYKLIRNKWLKGSNRYIQGNKSIICIERLIRNMKYLRRNSWSQSGLEQNIYEMSVVKSTLLSAL